MDGEDAFYGLRLGEPEISLIDILEGKTKYNNRPARSEKPYGTSFEYSDAGYCVLQLMIQDVTGKAFEDVAHKMVFDKLELENSFFATPENIEIFSARMAMWSKKALSGSRAASVSAGGNAGTERTLH